MKTAYCFDLDSTLTTLEILPCIASELNISEEMALLTKLTMDGVIDFISSFKLRVLLLSTVSIERINSIIDEVPLDSKLLNFIKENREQCFIVTGNIDLWIKPLLDKFECNYYSSSAQYSDGYIKLDKVLVKSEAIKNIRSMGFDRVIAVGDGMNDVPMFLESDIKIAFGAIHHPPKSLVNLANYIVYSGDSLCNLLKML